jgi:hypothetical protein
VVVFIVVEVVIVVDNVFDVVVVVVVETIGPSEVDVTVLHYKLVNIVFLIYFSCYHLLRSWRNGGPNERGTVCNAVLIQSNINGYVVLGLCIHVRHGV